nr:DciA family protein [Propylenella binzhouense]
MCRQDGGAQAARKGAGVAGERSRVGKPVGELVAGALDPVVRKRGLARAELFGWWPDIVGEAYAAWTLPERIRWPRGGGAATLVVKCDPSVALQLSYELEPIRQRLNSYFGHSAVGAVRIVQHPVRLAAPARPVPNPPDPEKMAVLERRLAGAEEGLRGSLVALGRLVLARS